MPHASELVVAAVAGEHAGYPDPVGRQGEKIVAEPSVWLETCAAEFHFTQCQVVRLWDDGAMLGEDATDTFEGDTFRLYSASDLLAHLRPRAAGMLFHYRLLLDNGGTVIDVVTRKAPHVVLREFQSQATTPRKSGSVF